MLELRNVLELNPKNAEAIYYAGLIHKRGRRTDQAIEAFYRATLERPSFIEAQHELGSLALARGGLDIASGAAQSILKLRADHPDGLALAAAVASRQGDPDAAARLAGRALEQEPHHEQAVSVLAGLDNRSGQPERALARVNAAIEARPASVLLRITKIALLEEMGSFGPLAAAWQDLIELQPEDPAYRLALAEAYLDAARPEDAIATLRVAIHDIGALTDRLIEVVREEHGFQAAEQEILALLELDIEGGQGLRFNLARLYADADRLDDAQRVLGEIAEDGADVAARSDALASLAEIDLEKGQLERAEAKTAEVLGADLDHPQANLVQGLIMLARDQPVEAIRYARAALRGDSDWAPALRLAARAHLANGEPTLAVPELVKVMEVDPGDLRSAELLATLLTESGDHEVALKVWSHILEIDGASAAALRGRAQILLQGRDWERALADIERLEELPGQEVDSMLLAGELLVGRGNPAAGRERFARAQALAPDAREPLIGLIRSYLAQSDLEGALAFLDDRLADRPEDALTWSFKAQILSRLERWQETEQALEQAVALAPEEAAHHRQLGRLLLRRNAPDRAIRALERGRAAVGDDVGLLSELAWAYYLADQPDRAIDTYGRLLELAPASSQAANNYASLVATYRPDDQASLSRALAVAAPFRASDDPIRLDTLGWLYYRTGDFPVAQTFLRRALSLAPENPEYHYHLGMTLMAIGDAEGATEHLKASTAEGASYIGLEEARAALKKLTDAAGGSARESRS